MLLRFSASNHGSIYQKQELSLVATSLKDRNDVLIEAQAVPGGFVLPGAIIYGANASGKSNILDAYKFIEECIIFSHSNRTASSKIPRKVFALDKSAIDEPSNYDVDFVLEDVRYHFGFSIDRDKFVKEWLYAFPSGRRQLLYERRDEKTVEFGRALKGRNRVIADLMRPNSLFISAAMQNNHDFLTKIGNVFVDNVHIDRISVDASLIGDMFWQHDIDDKVINFLNKIKTGVVGYQKTERILSEEAQKISRELEQMFKKISPDFEGPNHEKAITIELFHNARDGTKIPFRAEQESSGTRRLLVLLTGVFTTLNEGGYMIIDELDASLHTQAAEAIIQLFANKKTNPHGAQLIVTAHDTNIMRSRFLRRDQIWFVEKDDVGATHLYPLSEIKVRKDDNIEKGYLQGRFGAIPFAGPVDIFDVAS